MDLLERFHSHEDFHQSVEFAAVMESIGWSSIPVSGSRMAVRQLGPVSLAKIQRSQVINFKKINKIRRRLSIFRTVIEPSCIGTLIDSVGKSHNFSFLDDKKSERATELFTREGYKPLKEHYSHSKTAILDVRQPIENLTRSFPSKTRYNIKIANRLVNSY